MNPIAYMLAECGLSNRCICVQCTTPLIRDSLNVYAVFMRQSVQDAYCTVCMADIVSKCEIEGVAI